MKLSATPFEPQVVVEDQVWGNIEATSSLPVWILANLRDNNKCLSPFQNPFKTQFLIPNALFEGVNEYNLSQSTRLLSLSPAIQNTPIQILEGGGVAEVVV